MNAPIQRVPCTSDRSGRSLRQIIRDTKRTDLYLDAQKAKEYGLIDEVLGPADKALNLDDAAALAAAPEQRVPQPVEPTSEIRPAAAASQPQFPDEPGSPSTASDPTINRSNS